MAAQGRMDECESIWDSKLQVSEAVLLHATSDVPTRVMRPRRTRVVHASDSGMSISIYGVTDVRLIHSVEQLGSPRTSTAGST